MACYFYTGIWTIIEISSHFFDPFAEWSRGNLVMFIVIAIIGLSVG